MNLLPRFLRALSPVIVLSIVCGMVVLPSRALAETTGTISGTITDADSGAPVANAQVSAASPSGSRITTTNARGFYVLQALIPDTYTLSVQATGYQAMSIPGIAVFQGETAAGSYKLSKAALTTIANVHARSPGNLVQPNQTADTYNITGDQLNALAGGNNLHKTLYQYVQGVPGVTTSGYPGEPRIHGGAITDIGYEFDGIPIKERITGFFTTNLSNVGISNVEVTTGGLPAEDATNGTGVINTVVKVGTYPGFGALSYGTTFGSRNLNLVAEYGGATVNKKFTYYFAVDKTGSQNQYSSGQTYPAMLIEGYNGPGQVYTTDLIGNFHWRPNANNDFQFLIQNGLGDFNFSYLMQRTPGEPIPLTANPCPGNRVYNPPAGTPGSPTGNYGGTAPNGQFCPIGLYFGTADTQNGGGNIWHHYSGLGKIQWNHIINDHSLLTFRLAENFNQYIFDQPIVEANLPQYENNGDFWVSSNCPLLPYAAGTPIASSSYNATTGAGTGRVCAQQQNWFNTGYEGDRRENMYLASLDYANDLSANMSLKAGLNYEYDNNLDNSYFTFYFNPNGSWPGINTLSSYPDHIPGGYVDLSITADKFKLAPGVLYQRMYYDYPGGPYSTGVWNPTFAFTYTMGRDDVIRGSYTNGTSFVGTGSVYYEGATAPYLSPKNNYFSANPTIIHFADLQWEHQFNYNTSLRFGPYFDNATNIFYTYSPIIGTNPPPPAGNGLPEYGPARSQNGGIRKSFGFELGINHDDDRPVGVSWWLSATLDNFWTNMNSALLGTYGSPSNPSIFPLTRDASNPPFSGTFTMDIHQNDVSLIPSVYYQAPTFYQTGMCFTNATQYGGLWYRLYGPVVSCQNGLSYAQQSPLAMAPELQSGGYFIVNATLEWRAGRQRDWVVGIQGQNILNNTKDVAPCWTSTQSATPGFQLGCAPFYPINTPQINVNPGYTYQNYSQTPATFWFFVTKKL